MPITVKQRPLLKACTFESAADALARHTKTFWRVHSAAQGRALEDLQVGKAITMMNNVIQNTGPQRHLQGKSLSLSMRLIRGNPKQKKSKQSATILSVVL